MIRIRGYAAAALSAALFGLIALFTTSLYATGATGFQIVFWRMAVAGVLLAGVLTVRRLARGRGRGPRLAGPVPLESAPAGVSAPAPAAPDPAGVYFLGDVPVSPCRRAGLMLLASLLYAASVVALCLAYGSADGGLANALYHTYPVVFILTVAAAYRRRPAPLKVAAVLCASVGTVCVLVVPSWSAGTAGWGANLAGVVLALLSAVFFALYNVVLERDGLAGVSTTTLLLCQCAVCALVCLPFVAAAPVRLAPEPAVVGLVALLAVVCTVVPYLLYIGAVQEVGAQVPTLLSYLDMPVTIATLALASGTVPVPSELTGCAFIALGGMLSVLPERRPVAAP